MNGFLERWRHRLARRRGLAVFALFLLALALRFGYAGWRDDRVHNEGREYFAYADNLAAGRGYRQQIVADGAFWYSRRLPVIPVLLALARAGGGDSYRYLAGFGYALASALAVPALYLLGAAGFNRRIGFLAAALLAVYPEAVYYSSQLNDATPMLLLTILVCLSFARLLRSGRALDAVFTGFWLGISVQTHSHLQLFWVPMFLCLALAPARRGHRLVNAALLLLVFALVLTPWTIRNYRIHGVLMPGGSSFWREVYIANNETIRDNLGGFNNDLVLAQGYYRLGELEAGDRLRREALAFIAAHPGQYAWFALNRLWGLWRPLPHVAYVPLGYGLVMLGSYGALLPFIGWGLWAARRRWRRTLVYYLLFAYFSAICAAVICVTRYRLFFTGPLLLFAAYGLVLAGRWWFARRRA